MIIRHQFHILLLVVVAYASLSLLDCWRRILGSTRLDLLLWRIFRPNGFRDSHEPFRRSIKVSPALRQSIFESCVASFESSGSSSTPSRSTSAESLIIQPPETVHERRITSLGVEEMKFDEVVPFLLRFGSGGRVLSRRSGGAGSVESSLQIRESHLGREQVSSTRWSCVERSES